MLKFFREYSKWILVVGGTLLMIAFLIQPVMSLFMPTPEGQEIGRVGGKKVTLGERQAAAFELQLLGMLGLSPMLPLEGASPDVQYLLMLREADRLGVSSSQFEVEQVLQAANLGDPAAMARLLQQTRTTQTALRQAIANWVKLQQYMSLVEGRTPVPPPVKMQAMQLATFAAQQGMLQYANQFYASALGSPRLSGPLLEQFVTAQRSVVEGEVVLIGHEKHLDRVGQPTDAQLTELFEAHKDDLPGLSTPENPHALGYRTPARAKVEWLEIPIELARAKARVDEAEAIAFYDSNKARFEGADYAAARDEVVATLRQRKAEELAAQAAKLAQTTMAEDPALRGLRRTGGYLEVPADFQPAPLAEAARRVEERTGITPRVERLAENWTPLTELPNLPTVGRAELAGRDSVTFQQYAASARELEPPADNPLAPLRLQVGVPSEPLRSFNGTYAVFRLVAAEPGKDAASLDAVRDQVAADWRKLEAFRLLVADREQYVQAAKDGGLEAVASTHGAPKLQVGPIARRVPTQAGLATPALPGIGVSDALLDGMFDMARRVEAGEGTLEAAPPAERISAAGVEPKLSLGVYRVDTYRAIPRSTYEAEAKSPSMGANLDMLLLREKAFDSPFSLEALAKRLGYTGEGLNEEDEAGMGARAAAE